MKTAQDFHQQHNEHLRQRSRQRFVQFLRLSEIGPLMQTEKAWHWASAIILLVHTWIDMIYLRFTLRLTMLTATKIWRNAKLLASLYIFVSSVSYSPLGFGYTVDVYFKTNKKTLSAPNSGWTYHLRTCSAFYLPLNRCFKFHTRADLKLTLGCG